MKISKQKLAFSLIELSVVILIIGILVIGITKGTRIVSEAKLRSAKALTTSSPVASIDSLVIWVETTLDKSISDSERINTALGTTGTISSWNDINPNTTSQNNATQNTTANKPRYVVNGVNGLPVLNFDGIGSPDGDYLSFNGTSLANNNYTIFAVERRRSAVQGYFISGSDGGGNMRPHLGYRSDTVFTFAQFGNDIDYNISGYKTPIAKIHSFWFNSNVGKKYYLNGVLTGGTCSTVACKTGLISYIGAQIAHYEYNGDIGEIIIFNKSLTDAERVSVEKYLGQKWGIKIG